jgi:hypothetical protein
VAPSPQAGREVSVCKKAVHAFGLKTNIGPSGSLESRTAIESLPKPMYTHSLSPPMLRVLLRQAKEPFPGWTTIITATTRNDRLGARRRHAPIKPADRVRCSLLRGSEDYCEYTHYLDSQLVGCKVSVTTQLGGPMYQIDRHTVTQCQTAQRIQVGASLHRLPIPIAGAQQRSRKVDHMRRSSRDQCRAVRS